MYIYVVVYVLVVRVCYDTVVERSIVVRIVVGWGWELSGVFARQGPGLS